MGFWLLVAVGTLVVLVATVAILGSMLPRDHVASSTQRFPKSPEQVWQVVTDFAGSAAWRQDLKGVDRMPDQDGKPVWKEIDKRGDGLLLRTEVVIPPKRLERRIVNEKHPFGGKWVYDFKAAETGCDLTITEYGEVYNIVFRFIGHFFLDQSASIKRYLQQLANRLHDQPSR